MEQGMNFVKSVAASAIGTLAGLFIGFALARWLDWLPATLG